MLEVKNLFKKYKPKKGVAVQALDNVSLKFPEVGMIFVLGKSGSGKSTLLNILGGLDVVDSGEIIIHNKSSKTFKQSDFDSYRNTYLGFIFQEYNILDDFSIGANIGLALELQGKKATNEEINAILEEVDLVGYASRKPNELSGGQKQRVAIARALVKNPQIILADEPTGALDSNTGKQVFDTLKKLSKNKLVIIVSHDREFSESYGDRVIELADGQVIHDDEKHYIKATEQSSGIKIIDEKIIKVEKNYKLTAEDLKMISKYISGSENDVYITLDERSNTSIKASARIDNEGNRESFKKTNEDRISKEDRQEFKIVKSRLSIKHCLRIGASSLKVKPFRLFLTILLSFVAFAMFGLADTVGSYNKIKAETQSILDTNIKTSAFTKQSVHNEGDYSYTRGERITEKDIADLNNRFGLNLRPINTIQADCYNFFNKMDGNTYSQYYTNRITGYTPLSDNDLVEYELSVLQGRIPNSKTEIALPLFIYEHFVKYGYKNELSQGKDVIEASEMSMAKLIGKKIYFNSLSSSLFTISGIIDTGFNGKPYEDLKNDTSNGMMSYFRSMQFESYLNSGFHNVLFISPQLHEALNDDLVLSSPVNGDIAFTSGSNYLQSQVAFSKVDQRLVKYNNNKTSLGENEAIIPLPLAIRMLQGSQENWYYKGIKLSEKDADMFTTKYFAPKTVGEIFTLSFDVREIQGANEYLVSFANWSYDMAVKNGFSGTKEDYITEVKDKPFDNQFCQFSINDYSKIYAVMNYFSELSEVGLEEISYEYRSNIDSSINKTGNLLITGLYCGGVEQLYDEQYLITSDSFFTSTGCSIETTYERAVGLMPKSEQIIREMVIFSHEISNDGYILTLNNEVMAMFGQVNGIIEAMAEVFLYVGIGFAIFSSLMLFNFISVSISYKRREIGILRAVGARSKDVFGIFFSESLVITLINFVLATITLFIGVEMINSMLRKDYGLVMTILNPNFRQIMLIFAVSIGVAFISSFFPVYKIASKRPIEAIRNK